MSPESKIAPSFLVLTVEPGERIEAFRTVRTGSLEDPDLPLSFRSHHEEGLAPRYRQTQHAALHTAVSFWRAEEVAREMAKRFPKHGGYIARVVITDDLGINYMDPDAEPYPEHLTIWGPKETLAGCVVDIFPVQ